MCTVTIVPQDDGFRLACNRDERRDRPPAMLPAVHRQRGVTAVYPVDPVGGGTWVGGNTAGLVAALLNRTMDGTVPAGSVRLRSRGLIVPPLLGCRVLADAVDIAAATDPMQFNRFRLVVVQGTEAALLTSDGWTLSCETLCVSRPFMLTSSSLGDDLVEAPRRRLFERMVIERKGPWSADAQTRFHAHRWRSRAEISVNMERPDARTVSRTFIRVGRGGVELRYSPFGTAKATVVRVARAVAGERRIRRRESTAGRDGEQETQPLPVVRGSGSRSPVRQR
jgi:hypothetical protein